MKRWMISSVFKKTEYSIFVILLILLISLVYAETTTVVTKTDLGSCEKCASGCCPKETTPCTPKWTCKDNSCDNGCGQSFTLDSSGSVTNTGTGSDSGSTSTTDTGGTGGGGTGGNNNIFYFCSEGKNIYEINGQFSEIKDGSQSSRTKYIQSSIKLIETCNECKNCNKINLNPLPFNYADYVVPTGQVKIKEEFMKYYSKTKLKCEGDSDTNGNSCKNKEKEGCCCCEGECLDNTKDSINKGCCPNCLPDKLEKYVPKANKQISEKEFETLSGINVEFFEGVKDSKEVISNLYKVWNELTPEVKKVLPGNIIEIYKQDINDEDLQDSFGICISSQWGIPGICINPPKGGKEKNTVKIKLKEKQGTDICIIRHELTHAYLFLIPEKESIKFYEDLLDISGEVYGLDNNIVSRSGRNYFYKKCIKYNGPMEGGVNPNSLGNYQEDPAYLADTAYCYPNWFNKVLNPKYKCCYDKRYGEKLKLLLNEKIISQDEYSRVLKAARVG